MSGGTGSGGLWVPSGSGGWSRHSSTPSGPSGRLAAALAAIAVAVSVVAIVQLSLSLAWTISSIAVVLAASGASFALLRRQWPNPDAQMEAAIAAAGVAIAMVLLAAQISVDDRRSAADERRAIQFNATQSVSLDGASLDDADLSGINLIDKSLANATIQDSTLDDGNFQRILAGQASFDGSTGQRADFSGAFLQLASFQRVHLVEADFRRADLGGADLSGFVCERCNFDGASLMAVTTDGDTNLDGSIASKDTIWPVTGIPKGSEVYAPGSDMRGLRVRDFDLTGWNYTDAELTGRFALADTDLREADLTGLDLDKFPIDGSILADADLTGVIFGDRRPEKVLIDAGTRVDRARLGSFLDLDERPLLLTFAARYVDLDLRDVQVANAAAIRESSFAGSTITGADFSGVDLTSIDFFDAILTDVRFDGAKLDGTLFTHADLTGISAAGGLGAALLDAENTSTMPVIYDSDTRWPAGFDGFSAWGWIDANGPIELRHPAVVAAPELAREQAPYGKYRPAKPNWILKGVSLDGLPETTPQPITPSSFEDMQFTGVSLRNRNLDESKLYFCEFHGVDLRGSSLRNANVARCNLETAILSPPDRSGSQFGFTQYQGMIYDANTRFPPGFEVPDDAIELPGSIAGQELIGVEIGGNPLPGTDARGVMLDEATMSGVNFRGSDFTGALIRRAMAPGVQLSGVPLVGADLSDSDFSGANFQGADLQRANLTRTLLVGADLRGADLRGAILDGTDLTGAMLHGALLDDGALAAAIVG